jgi:hypothetical protein
MALGWTWPLTNEYQVYFLEGKGGQCVGLATLPPSCLEIWQPQPPGNLWTRISDVPVWTDRKSTCLYRRRPCVDRQEVDLPVPETSLCGQTGSRCACTHIAACSVRQSSDTLLHYRAFLSGSTAVFTYTRFCN